MRTNEETPGREITAASIYSDDAVLATERAAAIAALHRDIPAILPKLRRYARVLTRDVAAGDDLVQECVTRALAKVHLWTAGTDLRAWLFMILHNQYVSQLRRARRESKALERSNSATHFICAPQQIEQLELRELERAIRSLPEEQQSAVLLVGMTRATYEEIAIACDVPVGTIRSRLSRGRRTLRKLMGVGPPQHARAPRPARSASAMRGRHRPRHRKSDGIAGASKGKPARRKSTRE